MAPSRKPKSENKRFTYEASPEIDVRNSSKTKQRKKKVTDKLGPQWTKGELERFYDTYRKHGGDWKKVAAAVQNNRSVDMVESLFYMNRAYLSLPEGIASVTGFIAMMTDHYGVIEDSENEGEGHGVSVVLSKYQKRKRAKTPSGIQEEVIPPHPIASAEGCLSFLKLTKSYGKERRATGKRTPRFLVPSPPKMDDREGYTPPNKRSKKQLDADDDEHVVALTSRRAGVSPYRRTELNDSTPVGKKSQTKKGQSKHSDISMFENGVSISRDRRHIKGAPDRDGAMEVSEKGKMVRCEEAEGNDSDDSGEPANERLRAKSQKGIVYVEASGGKYSLDSPRKRNEKLLYEDELEALRALAEMSVSLPPDGLMESESSAQLKEDRIANNMDEKSDTPETVSRSHHREKAKQAGPEDSLLHEISATDSRKPKVVQESVDGNAVSIEELGTLRRKRKLKVQDVEATRDSVQNKSLHDKELAEDDNLKTLVKARRAGQGPAKQLKTAKTSAESASTNDEIITEPDVTVTATQVSGLGPANLPQKPNRRKMSLKKSLQERDKSSETTQGKAHSDEEISEHESLKEKVSTCLSCPLVRRRCIYEWFYSAIDYPWYAKMEFVDYLNHVGLDHVPRLARLEWSVIKSSLGRPRRFSEKFIQEERDKLNQYRESVRKHYTELRVGAKEGLPTDLARPLSVGNRVIAIHPKTREICDGKILTVDHNKCNILFDGLGVELVADIECMPLNPLEYMPEGLRRQIDNCLSISKEAQVNRHPNSDASVLFRPSVLENVDFSMKPPVKQDDKDRPVTTDQLHNTTNSKARRTEIQRTRVLQHTSDAQEMEPEMLRIVSGSKSIAQAMVDAAMKAASSVKDGEDAGKMVQQALDSIGEHHPLDNSIVPGLKHQDQSNGSLDHHHQNRSPSNTAEQMTNGFMGSGRNETQMPSELITSCVATWLMIQMCTEKQYPPEDVAQLMETAVSNLQPRCPQNMPIYREIQTCMGWIKTQIMALVRT